ncbi:MAG: YebC/PmpR family DNA-binding transcriptional regulator, partial [Anaerolineae bacterium]|nr:YebC/PmpR family DNA-binding transcriptional regulator [Anaerolineae bacterium]
DRPPPGNMPKDSNEPAHQRAAGAGQAEQIDEVLYEGYGPHGVAILMETLTDNRNRTVSQIRTILTKRGGNMAEGGAVAWQFDQKGVILIELGKQDPDEVSLMAIDLGADDVVPYDGELEVLTAPENLQAVREGLLKARLNVKSAELARLPKVPMTLSEADTEQVMGVIEALEDLDDVQRVFSNLEVPDEMFEKMGA